MQANLDEEVHGIVGGEQQQRASHDAARAEIVVEDGLVGRSGKQKVCPEEDHQRQGRPERIFI